MSEQRPATCRKGHNIEWLTDHFGRCALDWHFWDERRVRTYWEISTGDVLNCIEELVDALEKERQQNTAARAVAEAAALLDIHTKAHTHLNSLPLTDEIIADKAELRKSIAIERGALEERIATYIQLMGTPAGSGPAE